MAGKRKRPNSEAQKSRDESRKKQRSPSTSSTTSGVTGAITIAENSFHIEVMPISKAPASANQDDLKHTSGARIPRIHKQNAVVEHGPRCAWSIKPAAKWHEMRKYSKFIVADKSFTTGDYVFVWHGNQQPEAKIDAALQEYWVAQVLEIRAVDSAHVYLRVFWYYWPDELPNGRAEYHGHSELVASNFMQVIDAMTVTDMADVKYWDEKEPVPAHDLYWRQTLDVTENYKLSEPTHYCYCDRPNRPEDSLVSCPHCDTLLHEECLARDACSRTWTQEQEDEKVTGKHQLRRELPGTPKKMPSTIPDSQTSSGTSMQSSHQQVPPPPTPKSNKPRNKRQKLIPADDTDPWARKMIAKLEYKENTEHDEPSDATGMATVTYDVVDGDPKDFKVGLRCLMAACGKWLYTEPQTDTGKIGFKEDTEATSAVKQELTNGHHHRESHSEETLVSENGTQKPGLDLTLRGGDGLIGIVKNLIGGGRAPAVMDAIPGT